ncbi:MarR family transcriptional regulator [Phycicoccus sp. BSK3Z-2]|uniref:MarR family transcriptional regulator n=1 Tax=Phycicoccus avicenniae TaxID=2828860 RepID=A0A941I035_9MICO|nr:MarR family transcriptional regulator [Phycicoccus avicenniae]MBR7744773.1 MarR family transcriptional regulator [Phycicoccus avicenniae]
MPDQPPTADDTGATDEDQIGWALHRLAVAGAALDSRVASGLGVSATDYLAVKHVMVADPAIGSVELSRLLGVTSGSATVLVDRLHRAGLLERAPHPHDRRRKILVLTPRARQRILAALDPMTGDLHEMSSGYTSAELDAVRRFLSDIVDLYQRHQPSTRG